MADESKGHDAPAAATEGKGEEELPTSPYKLSVNRVVKDMPSEVFVVRFSADGTHIASGLGDGSIRVLNTQTGHTHLLNVGRGRHMPVTSLRFRPVSTAAKTKNVLLAVDADGVAKHWHITSGKCLHTIEAAGTNQLFAVDYRSDGTLFATAGSDKEIRIYDEATKTLVAGLSGGIPHVTVGHSNRVFSLKFVPGQPNILVSGGWDSTVQVWDIRAGHSVRSAFGPYIAGDAVDVYDNVILTGSCRTESVLQTFDLGTCRMIEEIKWSNTSDKKDYSKLYSAQFSPDGKLIAAGGFNTNMARVFDRTNSNAIVGTLAGLSRAVFSVAFGADNQLAVAGGDHAVRIFDIANLEGDVEPEERFLTLSSHTPSKK